MDNEEARAAIKYSRKNRYTPTAVADAMDELLLYVESLEGRIEELESSTNDHGLGWGRKD